VSGDTGQKAGDKPVGELPEMKMDLFLKGRKGGRILSESLRPELLLLLQLGVDLLHGLLGSGNGGARLRRHTEEQRTDSFTSLPHLSFYARQGSSVALFEAAPVVGEVENVIGLVVGKVELEQVQAVVDGVDEADLPRQGMDGPDAAAADTACAGGHFVVDVAGGEHGSLTATAVGAVETTSEAALAVGQLPAYLGFHLKSLGCRAGS
jgi:hypothetical protein